MERPVMTLGECELRQYDGQWLIVPNTKDEAHFRSIRDCEFGSEDVLIASYPKSGTMWLCRILSLILTDADVKKAEIRTLQEAVMMVDKHQMAQCLEQTQPRCLRTHYIYKNIPRSFREGKGKDLRQGIARIAAFVGRRFSPQQTDAMVAACSFEAMRQSRPVYAHWLQQHNDDDAKFLRKGKIGDWRNVYTESMNDAVDKRVEREITPLGIDIIYG